MNRNVNPGLWVMRMCQCRFISYTNCPTLAGDPDNDGGSECAGQEVYGTSLRLPLDFVMNLKLL